MNAPLLSIKGVQKTYAVPVLQGIDLEVAVGEVHALVGANGAGKTTLCNIVCGLTNADSGSMQLSGSVHSPVSLSAAQASGVRIVMQELKLIDALSVADNLYFDLLPTRRGLIDQKRLFNDARVVLASMGMGDLDPATPVGELGIGQQQLVEIGRELIQPCKLLILDEPTAALTDIEVDLLFEKIESLKAQGTAIIYVSHRMDEIRRVADRISVLRDGQTVARCEVGDISIEEIVQQMAGDAPVALQQRRASEKAVTALRVRGLSTSDLLRDINLDIRFGEILGITGLMGSGRTELLRAIYAADELSAGCVTAGDSSQPLAFKSPADAVAYGIGLIPEDRKRQGLLLQQSVMRNMTLSALGNFSGAFGWINPKEERSAVETYRTSLDIKCASVQQLAGLLSGGNQQKVSIARYLLRDCQILLFDEPTRGIDVHAKLLIYKLLGELAGAGKAVVLVSSESREVTDLCDRIAVLSNGELAATFSAGEWSAEKIMTASFSAFVGASLT